MIRSGKMREMKRGLWHKAIVVAIINEKNEILLQQRSEKKEKNVLCGIFLPHLNLFFDKPKTTRNILVVLCK